MSAHPTSTLPPPTASSTTPAGPIGPTTSEPDPASVPSGLSSSVRTSLPSLQLQEKAEQEARAAIVDINHERQARSKAPRTLPSFASSTSPPSGSGVVPPRSGSVSHLRYVLPTDSSRLRHVLVDFERFLDTLPIPRLSRIFPRLLARFLGHLLARRGIMASNHAFDLALLFWRMIINIFFRSIQPRGSWRIPKQGQGPVIFVAAPHHNQFLDPIMLASEARRASGRRVAFLTAEKSLKRRFVGAAARLMHSIPVARAADSSKPGKGKIRLLKQQREGDEKAEGEGLLLVEGLDGAQFTKQCQLKGQLVLPKEHGHSNAEIVEILSDTQIRIKKEFKDLPGKDKASEALRPDGEGVEYSVLPFVDQTKMYAKVYEKLAEGGSLGIFPEGGSHDRTDLLPLKAGVVIMALGAMAANPGLKVRIVPVGLSYFHPHKFRSRAVVEFGAPLDVDEEAVKLFERGGDGKRKAVGQMMDLVYDGLKSVTVRAPDYETLMVIQAARRLYTPPGQHTSLGQVVELNRRFILGYLKFRNEPKIEKVRQDVMRYNVKLRYAGLRDHQVERATRAGWWSLGLLAYRVSLLGLWGGLALPGVLLNGPIFILAKIISLRKAKEALAASQVKLKGRDVLATWKVLVSLVVAPILYSFYAGVATYLAHRYKLPFRHQLFMPIYAMLAQPAIAYSTLKFGEVGIDIYKSLPPLFISLLPGNHKVIMDLQQTRAQLSREIHDLIEEFAPQVWDDFESRRMLSAPLAAAGPGENKTTNTGEAEESILSHPLSWIDERLFGWGTSKSSASATRPSGKRRRSKDASATDADAPAVRKPPTAEQRKSQMIDVSAEERKLRKEYEALLSEAPVAAKSQKQKKVEKKSKSSSLSVNSAAGETNALTRQTTNSGSTTSGSLILSDSDSDDEDDEYDSADEDDESGEQDEGDYETVFRMLGSNNRISPGSAASSRRASRSRSRSHSRSGSIGGESFSDKRNRSHENIRGLIMSPTEQRSNPFGATLADAARSSATDSAAAATQRRNRTHSLQEDVSVEQLKSFNQADAARQIPFDGASTVLETQAAKKNGLKGRPALDDMAKASETPPGAQSPLKR